MCGPIPNQRCNARVDSLSYPRSASWSSGNSLGRPGTPPTPGELQDPREDLAVIVGVRPRRADRRRHPGLADHQRVLGAGSSAVDGAGAGCLNAAEGPDRDAVDDDRIGVELAVPLHEAQQVGTEPVPDAGPHPGPEPDGGRSGRSS